jgi:putative transposase
MNQECLLGEILEGKMILSAAGEIANNEWLSTPIVRSEIELDAFVIMPNHLHGIIIKRTHRGDPMGRSGLAVDVNPVNKDRAFHRNAPTLKPGTIGSIIGQFKSISTKKIREKELLGFHWQRNYYEHIIRSKPEFEKLRKYILGNPANWQADEDNPNNF